MHPPSATPPAPRPDSLESLAADVVACRRCPRLVEWREAVAAAPPRSHAAEHYWARPLPGFGDPGARLLVVGLAPAAHGGNRTGRIFTGDRSGDVLFAALYRHAYASQPESRSPDDGLVLQGAWVTAAVRCAPPQNRPRPEERDRCGAFLAREIALLRDVRVVVALGAFAYEALWRQPLLKVPPGRRPAFRHGLQVPLAPLADGLPPRTLLCSYHPSQRNVFTGTLTPAMLDAVLAAARALGA